MRSLLSRLRRMRRYSFVVDFASVVNSQVIGLMLGIVTSVILARALGPDKRGVVSAVAVVPGLLQPLVELGFRQTATYYVGKQLLDDQSVIWTLGLLGLVMSIGGVVTATLVFALTGLLRTYGWVVIVCAAAQLPFRVAMLYGNGILLGKKRINEVARADIIVPAANLVLLVPIIMLRRFQVPAVLLATAVSCAIAALYTTSRVKQIGQIGIRYVRGLPSRFVRLGLVYALSLFVLGLNYRLDILLLEWLSTTREIGVYTVGVGFAQLLWMLPSAVAMVNFSHSAAASDVQSHSQKTGFIMRTLLWGGLVPLVILYILAPWIIPLFYGNEYASSAGIVRAILPGVWAGLIFRTLNSDLAGRGQPSVALWVFGLTLAVNVALNFIWIPRYGALGSGWASSVSYSLGAVIFATVYARVTGLPLPQLLVPGKADLQRLLAVFGS